LAYGFAGITESTSGIADLPFAGILELVRDNLHWLTKCPLIVDGSPGRLLWRKSCKSTGILARIDDYGAKSCQNTVIFGDFRLSGLNGSKKLHYRRNFPVLVILSLKKLHFCSFVLLLGFYLPDAGRCGAGVKQFRDRWQFTAGRGRIEPWPPCRLLFI
jgi:hypothetical protein